MSPFASIFTGQGVSFCGSAFGDLGASALGLGGASFSISYTMSLISGGAPS